MNVFFVQKLFANFDSRLLFIFLYAQASHSFFIVQVLAVLVVVAVVVVVIVVAVVAVAAVVVVVVIVIVVVAVTAVVVGVVVVVVVDPSYSVYCLFSCFSRGGSVFLFLCSDFCLLFLSLQEKLLLRHQELSSKKEGRT